MIPKIKVFVIYGVSFLAIFLISRFIMVQFYEKQDIWLALVPIVLAAVFSPKPHKEETEDGHEYGLKSVFSKRVIPIK